MSEILTAEASALLDYLVRRLDEVVPGNPETYFTYKGVHEALGLRMQGETYGQSLSRQGLDALARWCIREKWPAITGLIVAEVSFQPEHRFYEIYGKSRDDFDWWRGEIEKCKGAEWAEVLGDEFVGRKHVAANRNLKLDSVFRQFLAGFNRPDAPHFSSWLPYYQTTLERIRHSIEDGNLEEALELIWKRPDNYVAHAGQGLLSHESVDRMNAELKQQIVAIARDSSPSSFSRALEDLRRWKSEGRIERQPTLLLSRSFASIAPDRYHTTVDVAKHNAVLAWMEEHSSFKSPTTGNWAERALALTEFLSRIDEFSDEPLRRNMFPWFVFTQIGRTPAEGPPVSHGISKLPVETSASIAAQERIIRLQHNVISEQLFRELVIEDAEAIVAVNQPSGSGGYIDMLVRKPGREHWLYEIKVTETASLAVRQALGQLLEYGFLANIWHPKRLVVVAEPPLDADTSAYIAMLREKFDLPLEYRQVVVSK